MARKPKPVDQVEYDKELSNSATETIDAGIIKPTELKKTIIQPIAIQQQQAFGVPKNQTLIALRNTKLGTIENVDPKNAKIFLESGNYIIL